MHVTIIRPSSLATIDQLGCCRRPEFRAVFLDPLHGHIGWVAKRLSAPRTTIRAIPSAPSAGPSPVVGARTWPTSRIVSLTARLHDERSNCHRSQRSCRVRLSGPCRLIFLAKRKTSRLDPAYPLLQSAYLDPIANASKL